MKHILLSTDFSENSMNAVRYAIDLWGTEDVHYTLLNCYHEPGNTSVVVSLTDFMKKESQLGLRRNQEQLEEQYGEALHLGILSHYGDLVSVMNKLSKQQKYSYAVIGAKGASRLESWLLGSNTINVVKFVDMPLLIVPVNKTYSPLGKVALAADYAHMHELGHLDPLITLVKDTDAELMIVHVGATERSNYEEALEGFDLHTRLEGIRHSFHAEVSEDVVEGIKLFAQENKVDVLSLVKRHRSFMDRLFHNSVTKELSLMTETPLLILHD